MNMNVQIDSYIDLPHSSGSVKVGDSVWVRGRGRITDQHMESLWSRICHWVF